MVDGRTGTSLLFPELALRVLPEVTEPVQRFWGNAKPPSPADLEWIASFGGYERFDPGKGRLSSRLTLEVADLKQATQIIVYYHYLHRGRTMAQFPYWVVLDQARVGVLLFSYPRLSAALFGIHPMNLLELARMWLSPSVQGVHVSDGDGDRHVLSVASCALGKALRRVRLDWRHKYPKLPDVEAVVSWADTMHHEGTVYKAANFKDMGSSGGTMHGHRVRSNGGRDQLNADYRNPKTLYLYRFRRPLPERRKQDTCGKMAAATEQLGLWEA